jgi:hypothetical protein
MENATQAMACCTNYPAQGAGDCSASTWCGMSTVEHSLEEAVGCALLVLKPGLMGFGWPICNLLSYDVTD